MVPDWPSKLWDTAELPQGAALMRPPINLEVRWSLGMCPQ